ncbi:MAG TPA: MBL fold metallo-hydrolase [Anaerolineales bacterium]|nr:MBL fold metallo-hydrolase [Anaerolineales bacterium]
MYTQQFFIEGLACASYLVGCEVRGVAAIVDPDLDVEKYLEAAGSQGMKITHIIETHLHADHVSGNTTLAARTGADIYIHEASAAEYTHNPLRDQEVIELGTVRIRVLHTPGHTPESVTLLLADTRRTAEPWLALTGDTLFVGDIGRPDLVGAEAGRGLAEDMYDSLFNRILPLDDSLMIYPGHGAGSLCGKFIRAMRSTSLGFERKYNPALAPRERTDFIDFAVSDLPEQPGSHKRIKALNRAGPQALGEVHDRPLTLQQALPSIQQGAVILDTREKEVYAKAHLPGSIHLEATPQLSNQIGFVVPTDASILLVLTQPSQYREVFYNLLRVGYDGVIGYLAESLETWTEMGLPTASGAVQDIEPKELNELMQMTHTAGSLFILDVREPWEFRRGHIPEAVLIPLGELSSHLGELDPEQPTAVICARGNRSQPAAAFLEQKGFRKVYNVLGGTNAWKKQGLELKLDSENKL